MCAGSGKWQVAGGIPNAVIFQEGRDNVQQPRGRDW
jgi:hypothetical protein